MKDEHMDRALSVAEKLATMMVDARRDADSAETQRFEIRFANACRVRPERGRKLTDGEKTKLLSIALGCDLHNLDDLRDWSRKELVAFVESLLAPAPEPNRANEAIAVELSNWRTWGGIHSLMGLDDESSRKHIAARLQPAPTPPPSELPTEEESLAIRNEATEVADREAPIPGPHSSAWFKVYNRETVRLARRGYVKRIDVNPPENISRERREDAERLVATLTEDGGYRIGDTWGYNLVLDLAYAARVGYVPAGELEQLKLALATEKAAVSDRDKLMAEQETELTTLRARVVLPMSEADREELAKVVDAIIWPAKDGHLQWGDHDNVDDHQVKEDGRIRRADAFAVVDALAPRIARVGIRELSASEIHKAFEDARTYPSNSEGDALTGLNLTRFAANILAKATGGAS